MPENTTDTAQPNPIEAQIQDFRTQYNDALLIAIIRNMTGARGS